MAVSVESLAAGKEWRQSFRKTLADDGPAYLKKAVLGLITEPSPDEVKIAEQLANLYPSLATADGDEGWNSNR